MGSTKYTHEALPEPFPQSPEEVETADWGDRDATVPYTFADGGFIVKFSAAGGKFDPLTGGWYYVPPGADHGPDNGPWVQWREVRGSYRRNEKERRAVILGRLNAETDFLRYEHGGAGDMVPVQVAREGQKALAAYLFAQNRLAPEAIAEKLDKAPSTIRQYLSDYKAGRTG